MQSLLNKPAVAIYGFGGVVWGWDAVGMRLECEWDAGGMRVGCEWGEVRGAGGRAKIIVIQLWSPCHVIALCVKKLQPIGNQIKL